MELAEPYDASQEYVRRLNKRGGLAHQKYDGEFPERWADQIFKYLSLPKNEFPVASQAFEKPEFDREYYERLSDKFRSPHLWQWIDDKGWMLRHRAWDEDSIQQEMTAASWQGNSAN